MKLNRWVGIFLLMALAACAHPISDRLRDQADPALSLTQILKAPNSYIGKKVVLGGMIVETRNREGVTEIEVVEKKLDSFGYPSFGDQSQGRFLFRKQGYLEAAIFSKGRMITGGGTLTGTQSGKIGEGEYEFPVIEVEELKLWDTPTPGYGYPPYPLVYGPYWGPWGPTPYYPYPRRFYGPYYPYYW